MIFLNFKLVLSRKIEEISTNEQEKTCFSLYSIFSAILPSCSKTFNTTDANEEPTLNVQGSQEGIGEGEEYFITDLWDEDKDKVDYFIRPNTLDKQMLAKFFQFHPHQPEQNIPFNGQKAYFRKDGSPRMWVTFRSESPAIFCSLCLAYDTDAAPSSVFY